MTIKRVSRKTLQNLRGQVLFRVRVSDNVRQISVIETASASSNNVRNDINGLKRRAKQNAIYKYLARDIGSVRLTNDNKVVDGRGRSVSYDVIARSLFAEILDIVDIRYEVSDSTRIKRENWKGEYVNVVRDKKGRIVRWSKWSNK